MSDAVEKAAKVQPAINQLRNHQQQLDMDGIFVGVSRQAIHEVLEFIDTLTALGWLSPADLAARDAAVTRRALEMAAERCVKFTSLRQSGECANLSPSGQCNHSGHRDCICQEREETAEFYTTPSSPSLHLQLE